MKAYFSEASSSEFLHKFHLFLRESHGDITAVSCEEEEEEEEGDDGEEEVRKVM